MTIIGRRILLWLLSALLIASSGRCDLEYSNRSISPSGQFIIYGGDAGLRGSVSALAERTKGNFLSLLKQRDDWRIAIVVSLQTRAVNLPDMPATNLRFSKTEAGLKLQLDLAPSEKISAAAVERELARVILLEMIYRDQNAVLAGDVFVEPPAWLVIGLLESAPNRNRSSLAEVLSTAASPWTLAEFLHQSPQTLDSIARLFYEAYSFILVQVMIDGPTGASRLSHYVANLALAPNDPVDGLRVSFPEMGDLEKAWNSKFTELKTRVEPDLLAFFETEEKLAHLVVSPLWTDGRRPVSIENAALAKLNPTERMALRDFSRKLLLLESRANPLLRPVVQAYQQIADQLVLGRTRGAPKRLAELKMLRARLAVRMSHIDDYLNWFEAAKMDKPSGIFEQPLHESPKPKRPDPLSVYLDAMELEF